MSYELRGRIALSKFMRIGLPSGVFKGINRSSSAPSPGTTAHKVGQLCISPLIDTARSAITRETSDIILLTRILTPLDSAKSLF